MALNENGFNFKLLTFLTQASFNSSKEDIQFSNSCLTVVSHIHFSVHKSVLSNLSILFLTFAFSTQAFCFTTEDILLAKSFA
jgi:hypothetical protein